MKRVMSIVLALCLMTAAMPYGATAFTDITDTETERAASLLQNMGIVSGTGGTSFSPNAPFDRATLAVIGVKLSGVFDVSTYGGTVRFPDVRASHWAHKWVMAAVELKIMSGGTDGNFNPSGPMLYGQLITVLMKLLGYTDADVGLNWPYSYISKAEALGISKGMTFSANSQLTRGQAARLIYNFLFLETKKGETHQGGVYIEEALGGAYVDAVLSYETSNGVSVIYAGDQSYTYFGTPDASLDGKLVTLLIDSEGTVLAVSEDDSVTYKKVSVRSAQSTGLTLTDGSYLPVPTGTGVWEWSGASKTFSAAYTAFWEEEPVTLVYKSSGALQTILRNSPDNKNGATNITSVLRLITKSGITYAVDNNGTEYRVKGNIDASLCGQTGRLTLDRDGLAAAFTAYRSYKYTTVTMSSAKANGLQPDTGSFITVSPSLPVWGESERTFGTAWSDFSAGESLLLAYNSAGSLVYIAQVSQRGTGSYKLAILEKRPEGTTAPLVAAFGQKAASATLYKNGTAATTAMLEQWDVLQYYESSNVIEACSYRLVGFYSSPSPNPTSPTSIYVMGSKLDLLPEATLQMPDRPVNQQWMFLLTADGLIADVRSSSEAGKPTLGLVSNSGVSITNKLIFGGEVTGPNDSQLGKLSEVRGRQNGGIYALPVTHETITDDLNLSSMKLGSKPIAPWCAFYEQVGGAGHAIRLSLSDFTMSRISGSKILYTESNASGYITTILLNDVTGDAYTYGFADSRAQTDYMLDGTPYTYDEVRSYYGTKDTGWLFAGSIKPPWTGSVVGISPGNTLTGGVLATALVSCVRYDGITRTDFDGSSSITLKNTQVPIANDVMVYIKTTGDYISISDARAYCRSFEVYTDPWGYKVRVIIGHP